MIRDSCNDLFRRAAWLEFGVVPHAFLAPYDKLEVTDWVHLHVVGA